MHCTFGSQDGGELAAVHLDGDILQDDARPYGADHLLEARPRLHLPRVEDVGQLQNVLAGYHDSRSATSPRDH